MARARLGERLSEKFLFDNFCYQRSLFVVYEKILSKAIAEIKLDKSKESVGEVDSVVTRCYTYKCSK